MIILTATMYPHGSKASAYELMHATIENRTRVEDSPGLDRYFAHVLARPNRFLRISGYEADVEVQGHRSADGPTTLILSVLNGVRSAEERARPLPENRRLAHITIEDAAVFEQRLRARS